MFCEPTNSISVWKIGICFFFVYYFCHMRSLYYAYRLRFCRHKPIRLVFFISAMSCHSIQSINFYGEKWRSQYSIILRYSCGFMIHDSLMCIVFVSIVPRSSVLDVKQITLESYIRFHFMAHTACYYILLSAILLSHSKFNQFFSVISTFIFLCMLFFFLYIRFHFADDVCSVSVDVNVNCDGIFNSCGF